MEGEKAADQGHKENAAADTGHNGYDAENEAEDKQGRGPEPPGMVVGRRCHVCDGINLSLLGLRGLRGHSGSSGCGIGGCCLSQGRLLNLILFLRLDRACGAQEKTQDKSPEQQR